MAVRGAGGAAGGERAGERAGGPARTEGTEVRRTVAEGLQFPESARWHAGRLWYVDMFAGQIWSSDLRRPRLEKEVDDHVGGIGWLPDGRLVAVLMKSRRVLCLEDGGVERVVDLSSIARYPINDLCVSRSGTMYVTQFGFDLFAGATPAAAPLIRVDPAGVVESTGEDLVFGNGCLLDPEESRLYVAETFAQRIVELTLSATGEITHRRVFAELPRGQRADGMGLDGEGNVWFASPASGEAICVGRDAEVRARVASGRKGCHSCVIGGDGSDVLFLCATDEADPQKAERAASGVVVAVDLGDRDV